MADVRVGDVWQVGRHFIMAGDATNDAHVRMLLRGNTPSCILTDPPYSSGGFQFVRKGSKGTTAKDYSISGDNRSPRGYARMLGSVLRSVSAVGCYVFCDWRMLRETADEIEAAGYGWRNMLVWAKPSPGMGSGWRSQHELVAFGVRSKKNLWPKRWPAVGNVIAAKRVQNVLHETQKPLSVIRHLVVNSPWAESIYDPFLGSGTTLVAAQEEERIGYGMEIEPDIAKVALFRLAEAVGVSPIRISRI